MTTAILTKVTRKTYGGGKPMVIAEWDNGDKGVTFAGGKFIGEFDRLSEGDSTEYSLKPGNVPGKDPLITFIKKAGGNGGGQSAPAQAGRPAFRDNRAEEDKQLSIFFSYAKDLVVSGVLKPGGTGIAPVVDLVASCTTALMDRFQSLRKSLKAEQEGAAAPTPSDPQ